jgi:hypothetical protein
VYADFTLESMKKHRRMVKQNSKFPIPPPRGEDCTASDLKFAELVAGIPKRDKAREGLAREAKAKRAQPSWISEGTWQLIRRKALQRTKRPTPDRRRETRRLKKGIKKGDVAIDPQKGCTEKSNHSTNTNT